MKNWTQYEELAVGSPIKIGMPTFAPYGLVKTVVCNRQTDYEPQWIRVPYNKTVDKIHLLEKLDNAMALSAVEFPDNLFTQTPLRGAWNARTSNAPVNTVKPFLRFCGWVQALQPNAFLRPSGRGAGSPYEPDWWKIAQRHPSPGSVAPWIKSAWLVASRILAPYGLKPIRHDRAFGRVENVAAALLASAPRDPRRAGFCWAALTIVSLAGGVDPDEFKWHTYRGARRILTGFSQAKKSFFSSKLRAIAAINGFGDARFIWRVVDDVAGWHAEAGTKKWIKKSFYVHSDGETGWLYEGLGRTYHAITPDAWRWVVREWRKQRNLEKASAETIARVTEKLANNQEEAPMTVIVTYTDSRRAGNCHDGTVDWTRRVFGTKYRFAAPLKEIFRYANEQRVLNVLTEITR